MLSDSELLAWYARRGTPERTRSVISHIRSTDPARRVGGGRCNVSGRYPSVKMGVTIQFESHRVELAAIYELEHDPEVLEYYDQLRRSSWTIGVHPGGTSAFSTRPTIL